MLNSKSGDLYLNLDNICQIINIVNQNHIFYFYISNLNNNYILKSCKFTLYNNFMYNNNNFSKISGYFIILKTINKK